VVVEESRVVERERVEAPEEGETAEQPAEATEVVGTAEERGEVGKEPLRSPLVAERRVATGRLDWSTATRA
jgi:hypothetical protein